MVRRLISSFALVACAGFYAFAAERATFILTDGSRQSGTVVFHTNTRENLIDNDFSLGRDDGGREMIFHFDQVAVIDFAGGRPAPAELSQLGAGHMLVMRDGSTQQGRFLNLIGGDTLVWDNQTGQRQQYAIRDVSRVYLNPQSARAVFNYRGRPGGAVATAGSLAGGTPVRVDANQAWTDTGITVNAGDRVVFQASGTIQFGRAAGQTATPDGNPAERRATYPDPSVPVGALIGRIGNSAPFGIGMQTQPLAMPASGRLMLGVNDNELADNSGFYTVVVTRQ
jgi:hypothetical protein